MILLILADTSVANLSKKGFYGRTYKDPYDLGFIVFDEKGDFWDREQLGDAYKRIEKRSRNSSKPPLLFIYIHGWNRNSMRKSARAFRKGWQGILTVKESKRRRFRLVPVHPSAVPPLEEYTAKRTKRFP